MEQISGVFDRFFKGRAGVFQAVISPGVLGAALLAISPIWAQAAGSATANGSGVGSEAASYRLAESRPWLSGPSPQAFEAEPGLLLAQADADDSYDPFADYSEFEQSADEEEDINFFRNGRLFTLGFIGGYRGWTGNLSGIYGGGPSFGLFLSYFFDLRFALQIGFLTGDYPLRIVGPTQSINGNLGMTDISFNLKYYFNTQNVTRGLADLNPFLIGGFSQISRTQTVAGNSDFAKDSAFGFNIGAGIELPMLRNKMYFGACAIYEYIAFADENSAIRQSDGASTGVKPAGDGYQMLGILGVNF